jgi:hypothetical protein
VRTPVSRTGDKCSSGSVGDVVFKEGDIFGDGVNVAARLEGLVRGGEICVSRGVHDHLRHRGMAFDDLGEQLVKNIAHPIRAFRLRIGGDRSEQEVPTPGELAESPVAVGVVTVAALYFGREVFVPMALAILLGFALAPIVLLLRRWHLGRVPSVIAVVVLAFLMIVGIGVFVGNQLAHLAGELPGYQTNIAQKIRSLRDTTARGALSTVPRRC